MGIIKFLLEDLKKDFKCLKDLITKPNYREYAGKRLTSYGKYIRYNYAAIIKEYWIWYLVVLFAFVCGLVLAAAYYQGKCQNIVNEITTSKEIIKQIMQNVSTEVIK